MVNENAETTPTPDSEKKEEQAAEIAAQLVVKSETTPTETDPTKATGGGSSKTPTPAAPESKKATAATTSAPVVPPTPEVEKKMRAVLLSSFGGLKGLKVIEKPVPPAPKEGHVTVQIKISALNFQDVLIRLGFADILPLPKTPLVLGTECIGVVTAVGDKVTKVKVDDLVFALPENGGAFAEFVSLDERLIFPVTKPQLPLETLACTFPYLVAHILLGRAGLQTGSTVLIHSAGGGVGLALVELAKLKGINVIGVANPLKHEALAGFGFKALIKRGQDYVAEVKKLHPGGLDAVFDPQGGDDCAKGVSLLGPWGSYIMYGTANMVTGENRGFLSFAKSWWSQVEKVSPLKLYEENKNVGGVHVRHLLKSHPVLVEQALDNVWELMANNTIHPVRDMTFYLEQMPAAMLRMHDRKNIGKILIRPELEQPAVLVPAVEEATPAIESVGATNGVQEGETSSTAK